MATEFRSVLTSATWLVGFLSGTAAAAPPIEAFGRKPAVIDVDINPAGTRLALLEENGNSSRLIIVDLTTGKDLRTVTAPAGVKLWHALWANDESVLISKTETQTVPGAPKQKFEMQRWSAIDVAGGSDRLMLMRDGNRDHVTGADMLRTRTATPEKSTCRRSTFQQRISARKPAAGFRATTKTPAGFTTPTKSTSRTARQN